MSTVAVSRHQPAFSPLWLAAMLGAIGLMAWIIQYDIDVPAVVMVAAVGVAGFALLVTGLMRPEIPFLALVAYVPFSRVLAGDFGGFMTAFNLTNILMVVVGIGYMLRTLAQHRPLLEKSGLNALVALFCALGAASLIRGILLGFGQDYATTFLVPLKRWLTPILLYFFAYNVARDRRTIQQVLIVIMMVVTVAALMAVKDYIDVGPNSSLDNSRIGGIAEQPNMLGAFFVYYMFLFASFWLMNWKKARYWALLLPFLACFRGIQVTFSRGAYLAFASGAVGLAFFRNKILWLLLMLTIVFAVMNPWILPKGIASRIESTFNEQKLQDDFVHTNVTDALDASAATRLRIWTGAVWMIVDHPWVGVGYGAFPYIISSYAGGIKGADAHNSYLIIASEMGVPTLVVFL